MESVRRVCTRISKKGWVGGLSHLVIMCVFGWVSKQGFPSDCGSGKTNSFPPNPFFVEEGYMVCSSY